MLRKKVRSHSSSSLFVDKDSPSNTSTIPQDEPKELDETSVNNNGTEHLDSAPNSRLPMELSREYMHVMPFFNWKHEAAIAQISAGFNHSALVTANGEVYTWGKSLDMQLGHGNKKEKEEPFQLVEPNDVHWAQVVAGSAFDADLTLFYWVGQLSFRHPLANQTDVDFDGY